MTRPEVVRVAIAGAIGALLIGCATSANVAPAVTLAMMRAAGGVSPTELNQGRRIFGTQCTTCHNADPVARYSFREWRAIIDDDMADRAKLDRGQRDALLAYISAAHLAPAAR